MEKLKYGMVTLCIEDFLWLLLSENNTLIFDLFNLPIIFWEYFDFLFIT